jgi:hypothetical protein
MALALRPVRNLSFFFWTLSGQCGQISAPVMESWRPAVLVWYCPYMVVMRVMWFQLAQNLV